MRRRCSGSSPLILIKDRVATVGLSKRWWFAGMEQRNRTDNRNNRSAAVVETFDLTRRFGTFTAVGQVSLQINAGQIFGLIGPNGAGKSTLIKMLTTMLPPSSGRAIVASYDIVTQASEVRKNIGYVPQLLSADGELTGYENLVLAARLYLVPRAERETRINEALTMMGLSEFRDRLVRNYSGGMIRRLEIAQSTLHRPAVVFMDEPTEGLDPGGRHAVWNHIRDLCDKLGTAVVVTTHYMDEADVLCDDVALIDHGRIRVVGAPAAIKASIGPNATLDDAFISLTGTPINSGGNYHDVRQTRRAAREHG
jgi:ABC-2 type transport system ATP-binding protein